MATTKVSALSALTTTDGAEELLINDGGTSKKVTIDNVLHDNSIRAEHYVDGSIATAHIADNAITSAKLGVDVIVAEDIANNAITVAELADNAVTTAKILDDNVTADKLANSINTAIAANTAKTTNATHSGEVTGATALTIADNVVDEANLKVSNSPTNGYFLSAQSGNTGGLTWAEVTTTIADGSITSAKIANGTIVAADIATDTITNTQLAANSVHASELADDAVDTAAIANDAVTTDKLANSINTDIATGVTANTTANAALPKAGGTMTGNIDLGDNVQARFGGSQDLLIYHDGSNSYIKEQGTGNLDITSNGGNVSIMGKAGENSIIATADGSVELYYDNVKKLETGSSGVDITSGSLRVIDNSVALRSGSSNGGSFVMYKDVTGSGSDMAPCIFAESGLPIHFMVNGSATTEMLLETDGDLHVDGDVIAYSTTVSDERLKNNIEVVKGALDKVKELKGVTFTRKQDGQESAGVIAQDVEKVLPQAVKHKALPLQSGDDELFKTVQYDALHALLIESIKELSARVEKLESK